MRFLAVDSRGLMRRSFEVSCGGPVCFLAVDLCGFFMVSSYDLRRRICAVSCGGLARLHTAGPYGFVRWSYKS
jgi:hypothetical protein